MMKIEISDYMKERVSDFVWKWKSVTAILIAIIALVAYVCGVRIDIRSNLSNVIALLSALLVVMTLIFTVLIYLKSQSTFNRGMASVENSSEIYRYLCSTIVTNIVAMAVIICIGFFETIALIVKYILIVVGTGSFSYSFIGTVYVLCWITDMIKKVDVAERKNTQGDK